MGVWIETQSAANDANVEIVTPCVGVWIETYIEPQKEHLVHSHTLRGCVD